MYFANEYYYYYYYYYYCRRTIHLLPQAIGDETQKAWDACQSGDGVMCALCTGGHSMGGAYHDRPSDATAIYWGRQQR